MKKLMMVAAACAAVCGAFAAEPHVDEVVATVLANVAKLKAAQPDAVPMAFWDFDGTVIKGDISEGMYENEPARTGKQLYKGLVEETILAGLLERPQLLRLPLVRNGRLATAGFCPEVWERWKAEGKL